VLRSPLAAVAALATGIALLVVGPAGTANAQQVCRPALAFNGAVCFYTGSALTGREYDVSVPVIDQLPVPTDGDCADLPTGFGLGGSVINASPDTLYVLPASCPDSRPGVRPAAIVPPHFTGDVLSLVSANRVGTPSVRMCAPAMTLDLRTLTCTYAH
jgi:hypothetical protein